MKHLLLLLALISPSFAQLPAIDYAGMFFSTVQVSPGQAIRKVPTLPATCTAVGAASSSNAVLYQGRVYMCTSTDTWTAVVTTTTGANLALSNLSSVSINAALIPQSAKDLGAQATPWKDLWLYGSGTFGSHSFRLTGTPTGHRVVTFPDAAITVAGSASALTSGRVPYVTTGGLLTNSAGLTYDGTSLSVVSSSGSIAFFDGQSSSTSIASAAGIILSNSNATTNNRAAIFFSDTLGGAAAGSIEFVFTDRPNNYGEVVFGLRSSAGYQEVMRLAGDGSQTLINGANFVLGTSTGTKIGTATTQKLSLWNATPIVQPSSTGQTAGFTAGAGTNVVDASTFTGGVGSTAYTIGDIVRHLKNFGLIAQ